MKDFHKCPNCGKNTISFFEKLLEIISIHDTCSNCRVEWTVSHIKFLWIALPFVVWVGSVLIHFGFLFNMLTFLIYIVAVTFFAPIKKVYN